MVSACALSFRPQCNVWEQEWQTDVGTTDPGRFMLSEKGYGVIIKKRQKPELALNLAGLPAPHILTLSA